MEKTYDTKILREELIKLSDAYYTVQRASGEDAMSASMRRDRDAVENLLDSFIPYDDEQMNADLSLYQILRSIHRDMLYLNRDANERHCFGSSSEVCYREALIAIRMYHWIRHHIPKDFLDEIPELRDQYLKAVETRNMLEALGYVTP